MRIKPIWRKKLISRQKETHCEMTTELGTRQYCRDNVTIFNTKLFVFAILLYLLWLLHPDTETKIFLDFFSDHWGSITLSGCCVVVIAKLKNCRVPSSGWQHVCESILLHERDHLFRPEYRKSRGNLKLLILYIVYVFFQVGFEPNPIHKEELDSTASALRDSNFSFLLPKDNFIFHKYC